jgi:hypothetical protein
MDPRMAAEEHLRVIRGLMERATKYRAISAPTALVGGTLSILLSTSLLFAPASKNVADTGDFRAFIVAWLVVLVITLLANTFLIWRKSHREGTGLLSNGLKLALYSALPAVSAAALVTALLWSVQGGKDLSLLVATIWILFYGIALLATSTFAPHSIVVLGWAFLVSGFAALLIAFDVWRPIANRPAALLMSLTFGLYHIIYATLTWPRKTRSE